VSAALVPEEASPTRVAAQVVSGIGFLGAGVIFREGMSARGLNTAATLWCSAAIGVLAGAGYLAYAALTAFGINDAGQIVGFYYDTNVVYHGFLLSGGAYTTFNDPLAIRGTAAYGINAFRPRKM
jgi:probable HAF family extracellular repeat protein